MTPTHTSRRKTDRRGHKPEGGFWEAHERRFPTLISFLKEDRNEGLLRALMEAHKSPHMSIWERNAAVTGMLTEALYNAESEEERAAIWRAIHKLSKSAVQAADTSQPPIRRRKA